MLAVSARAALAAKQAGEQIHPAHWSGVGQKKLMRCSGNQNFQCWNGIEINGHVAATKLTEAIFEEIANLPAFDDTILAKARQQWLQLHGDLDVKKKAFERRKNELISKVDKITEAVAMAGSVRTLIDKLAELEGEQDSVNLELRTIATSLPAEPNLPSLDIIKQRAKEVFASFGPSDPEVGRLMHALIPSLKVYPVRLCQGGRIELRARVQINLAALSDQRMGIEVTSAFCREISVNLFDAPQRKVHRQQVVSMRAAKISEKKIAAQLKLTITAVQRASALQRRMNELGLTDPYVPVSEADLEGSRCKRHLHARYQFQPLDDGASES